MSGVAPGEAAAWVGPNAPASAPGDGKDKAHTAICDVLSGCTALWLVGDGFARAPIDGDVLKWFAERIEADAGKMLRFLDGQPIKDR